MLKSIKGRKLKIGNWEKNATSKGKRQNTREGSGGAEKRAIGR